MGILSPVCIASDGTYVYAASHAFAPTSMRNEPHDWLVITRAKSSDVETSKPFMWELVNSFHKPNISITAFEYGYSCAATPAAGAGQVAFTLQVRALQGKNADKPAPSAAQSQAQVYFFAPNEVATEGTVVLDEKDNLANKGWSSIYPGVVRPLEGVADGGWLRAYNVMDSASKKNELLLETNVGRKAFAGSAQSAWTIPQVSTRAVAMDSQALFTYGQQADSKNATSCLGLNIVPIPSAAGRLDFVTPPDATKIKSVCLSSALNSTETMPYTAMTADQDGNVFVANLGDFGDRLKGKFYRYNSRSTTTNETSAITSWDITSSFPVSLDRNVVTKNAGYFNLIPLSSSTLLLNLPFQAMILVKQGASQTGTARVRIAEEYGIDVIPMGPKKEEGLSTGAIVGIAVGAVTLVVLVVGGFLWFRRQKKRNAELKGSSA